MRVKATGDGLEFVSTAPTETTSMVRAYLSTTQTIAADQWVTVRYDKETVDLNDEYANGVFTPKESGWYIVYAQAAFDYNDQGFRVIGISKNGALYS
ncbi:MAG: hypothetical protein J7L98_05705, partial [Candidatus Verstraetearchaeota archaeon]|nr:hypothetical protein [Candidatus Verstraetearchaeota archaeon]